MCRLIVHKTGGWKRNKSIKKYGQKNVCKEISKQIKCLETVLLSCNHYLIIIYKVRKEKQKINSSENNSILIDMKYIVF